MKIKVVLGGTLDYLFPAHGDDPCGSLWIPVDLCVLAQQLCSLWVDAHPLNSSRVLHFIQSPQLLGYPLAFLQLGRSRRMNCFGNHILERGKKHYLCPFLIVMSFLGQISMEMLELCCTPSSW